MSFHRFAAAAAATFMSLSAGAEILQGVAPLDTLGDIKHKYPNATIVPIKAAWVTENEGFYSLSGPGFPGVLYIAFTDSRPFFKKMVADSQAAAATSGASAPDNSNLQKLIQEPDEDALSVDWVRWIPAQPIPLARYKAKYGAPSKCDFDSATMQPYCSWEERSLLVSLSDNQLNVLHAEARFTLAEQRADWQARRHFVPDWLKGPPAKPASKATPAGKTEKSKSAI